MKFMDFFLISEKSAQETVFISPNVEFHIYCKFPENFSLPDWSFVIAGLDPAISLAKGIPASERENDISRSTGMTLFRISRN